MQHPRLQGLRRTQFLELSLQLSFTETYVLTVLITQGVILSLATMLERTDHFVYIKVLPAEKA